MTKKLSSFVIAFAISGLLALSSQSLSAAEYPLEEKLDQCEMAFKNSRDKSVTREQAAKSRARHFNLMVEILQNLNDANARAHSESRPLTAKELSNSVRVMGHLVEMLAQDHLAPQTDWSYVY